MRWTRKLLTLVITLALLSPVFTSVNVYAQTKSPLVWLKFDGDLTDSSGNHRDGTVKAGKIDYVSGPIGQAAYFNDAFVELANTEDINIKNNTATFSFWIKGKKIGNPDRMIFSKPFANDPRKNSFEIPFAGGNDIQVGYVGRYGSDYTNGSTIKISLPAFYKWDTWDYVTIVLDYDHIYSYVDGQLYDKSTFDIDVDNYFKKSYNSSDTTVSKSLMQLGYRVDKNENLSYTALDDFRFYDSALSASEVRAIYEEGNKPAYTGASSWAKGELDQASSYGLIPDSLKQLQMNQPISREEFCELAVLLYEKVTGKTAEVLSTNPFNDSANPQILKAYKLGITSGTSTTTFSPNVRINREQCASMLYRTIKAIKPDGNFNTSDIKDFPDQKKISPFAIDAAKYMSKLGIIKGDSIGNFMPKATTTAQEAAGYGMATREAAVLMSVRIYKTMK